VPNLPGVLLFFVLFISFAYFQHSEPGWNVNSRFVLTLALAETGSPAVERYVSRPGLETRDLASYGGRLYSDKSIGTSLLAVPAVWIVKGLETLTDTTFSTPARRWLVTSLSVGLVGAIAGVLLMKWLSLIWFRDDDRGASVESSCALALVSAGVMLGSMLFLYGTLLMSYLPAMACLLGCLIFIEQVRLHPVKVSRILFAGLMGGLAVLCEYTYAAAVGLAGIYLMVSTWRSQTNEGSDFLRLFQSAVAYALGGLIGIAPFLIYTISIFGRPTIPYEYHLMPEFREAMSKGFMGAGNPKLDVLWLITFHPFRGIFVYSPMLLLGFLGVFWILMRDVARRSLAVLCLSCILFYLFFNSAYYMWWGGWSFSPRHLAPTIPFFAAGLLPWLRHAAGRMLIILTGIIGVTIHMLVNATEPQPPDGGWQEALLYPDLSGFDYSAVFIQDTLQRISDSAFDSNFGSLVGLTGIASLLPLIGLWVMFIVISWRQRDWRNN